MSDRLELDDATRRLDLLADMIAGGHTGTRYARAWYEGAWAFHLDSTDSFGFHVILEGEVRLTVGDEVHVLGPGDVALLSTSHTIASGEGARVVPFSQEALAPYTREEGEGEVCMLCGAYEVEARAEHPIFASLPPLVVMRAGERAASVDGLVELLSAELAHSAPGSRTIASRLIDAMLVQLLRHWIASGCPHAMGWMGALRDPILGRALALIHHEYSRDWTLASLARAAGTSRSTLARNFSASVGEAPMSFLTRRRLDVAREHLRRGSMRLDEIAGCVGYSSAFALSKAYKREFGVAPTHSLGALR